MKNILVAAAVTMSAITAPAMPSWAAGAANNIGFCLKSDSMLDLSSLTKNEAAVIVTKIGSSPTNAKGEVVVSANNQFGKSASGSFWKSGMDKHALAGGNCYNLAIISKAPAADGKSDWACVAATPNTTGSVLTFSAGVVSGFIGGVSEVSANAPVINCPPAAS